MVSRPHRRSAGAILAAAAVSCSLQASARAAADLQGIEVAEVHEAEHSTMVRIAGLVAAVETRQVIVNPGDGDTEIFYAFDLPDDAAVTGAEIRLPDGRRAVATAVAAEAAFHFVDAESPGRPDVGLLRVVERAAGSDEHVTRYELRIYPVPAGKTAVATVRWHATVRYRDGRLELRIPSRGSATNRVRERFDVAWQAPAAARGVRDVRSGGQIAAPTRSASVRLARLRFTAPADQDVVLEARPVFRAARPLIAELATHPLDRTRGAYMLTVVAPATADARATAYRRVLLIVDSSRSLGATGIAAARSITDSLLDSATPGADMGAVVFARHARALGGGLGRDRARLELQLAGALRGPPSENGSDLGKALDEAATLLESAGSARATPLAGSAGDPTLIVIVTDAVLPLSLDRSWAAGRVGSMSLGEARIATVVLVPDQAPLPDPYDGPLGELARRTGGRVVTVRHGEAAARAPDLWRELAQPAPARQLALDWRGAQVTGDDGLPAELEAGEGIVLSGWYRGRPPSLQIGAELHGRAVSARPRRAGALAAMAALPLAVVNRPAELESLSSPAKQAGEEARPLLAAATVAGVATRGTSLVILDTSDGFARDRLAFARKWGPSQYRRSPPPAERAVGEAGAPDARPTIGRAAPPARRRTGELDRGIIQRLMKHHVVPRARACYDRALRRDGDLSGALTIELEMVRGEVQEARISRTTITDKALLGCLVDAAYATPVPQVALGDTGEVVVVARYPLRLRRLEKRSDVTPGPDGRPDDPDDPLGGIDP